MHLYIRVFVWLLRAIRYNYIALQYLHLRKLHDLIVSPLTFFFIRLTLSLFLFFMLLLFKSHLEEDRLRNYV